MASNGVDDVPGHVQLLGCGFDGDTINLMWGMPGNSTLEACPRIMEEATRHRLSKTDEVEDIFLYGAPRGYSLFRTELAKYLTEQYGTPVSRSELMATAGSTWAITEVGSIFGYTKAPIFVQNPTYGNAVNIFKKDFHANVVSVEADEKGLLIESFAKRVEEQSKLFGMSHVTEDQPYWGMVYIMPTFDNPTGVCLPPDRCRKVIQIARQYNLLVVCDDIYGLLHYTGKQYPPLRLLAYDDKTDEKYQGNVVSIGSFSKILAPGLRAGWLEGPERILDLITSRYSQSCGSVCYYLSAVLASALHLGLVSENTNRVREIYKKRLQRAVKTLDECLPSQVTYAVPEGGYFIWLRLPVQVNLDELCKLCEKFNVMVTSGDEYFVEDIQKKYIRVTIGYYEEDRLAEGVMRICRAIKEYLKTNNT